MRAGQAGDLRSDANPETLPPPSSPVQRGVGGSRLARNHLRVEMDELAVPLEDAPIDHDKIDIRWVGGADDECAGSVNTARFISRVETRMRSARLPGVSEPLRRTANRRTCATMVARAFRSVRVLRVLQRQDANRRGLGKIN